MGLINGFGLGLRACHYKSVTNKWPKQINWFEILTENYLVPGGQALYYLDQISERYPIVMHGVSMSLGSFDPLNWNYLTQLKSLSQRCNAAWVSDHLCWTGVQGKNLHDLLPLPLTEESLKHVVNKINLVQDFLGQAILIENPSTYISYKFDEITEWDFLNALCQQTDCKLLLDINNIYVSAFNHEYSSQEFIDAIPSHCVQQIHLAGHTRTEDVIIDTHDAAICKAVLELYQYAMSQYGFVPTMIERDDNIPALSVLLQELEMVKRYAHAVNFVENRVSA